MQIIKDAVETQLTDIQTQSIFLPDILNGKFKSKDYFDNFVYDEKNKKLFFVDTYPLIQFNKPKAGISALIFRKKSKLLVYPEKEYVLNLNIAAQRTGNPKIVSVCQEISLLLLK